MASADIICTSSMKNMKTLRGWVSYALFIDPDLVWYGPRHRTFQALGQGRDELMLSQSFRIAVTLAALLLRFLSLLPSLASLCIPHPQDIFSFHIQAAATLTQ